MITLYLAEFRKGGEKGGNGTEKEITYHQYDCENRECCISGTRMDSKMYD